MKNYTSGAAPTTNDLVASAIDSVLASYWSPKQFEPDFAEQMIDFLAFEASADEVETAIENRLASGLQSAWERGWLPREIIREVSRKGSALDAAVIKSAVASQYRTTPSADIGQSWQDHVESLDLPDVRMVRWMTATRELERSSWLDVVEASLKAIGAVGRLGVLQPLLIAPGGSAPKSGTTQRLTDREPSSNPMLEKIRSLLALAESTTFEAEAEAFTAKAQTLMAQHSLDEATVWGAAANRSDPSYVRFPIDDPYSGPKGFLLQVVADACGCSAVYHPDYAMSSVIGFDADLAATEVLFTSLLVQVQSAMQRYAKAAPPGTKSRSSRFSLLVLACVCEPCRSAAEGSQLS